VGLSGNPFEMSMQSAQVERAGLALISRADALSFSLAGVPGPFLDFQAVVFGARAVGWVQEPSPASVAGAYVYPDFGLQPGEAYGLLVGWSRAKDEAADVFGIETLPLRAGGGVDPAPSWAQASCGDAPRLMQLNSSSQPSGAAAAWRTEPALLPARSAATFVVSADDLVSACWFVAHQSGLWATHGSCVAPASHHLRASSCSGDLLVELPGTYVVFVRAVVKRDDEAACKVLFTRSRLTAV
jgi:hypothetical protein